MFAKEYWLNQKGNFAGTPGVYFKHLQKFRVISYLSLKYWTPFFSVYLTRRVNKNIYPDLLHSQISPLTKGSIFVSVLRMSALIKTQKHRDQLFPKLDPGNEIKYVNPL